MSNLKKQIDQNIKKSLFSLSPDVTTNISLWALISQPIKLIFKNWQFFFLFGVPAALLLTFSSLLSGHAVVCGIPAMLGVSTYACDGSVVSYYCDLIFRLILCTVFSVKWYQYVLLKTNITLKNLFALKKYEAKALGFLFLIIITDIAPIIALALLVFRTPNPNWQIELAYFTSVAWIFLLPLIAIRFYPYFALAAENKSMPSIAEMWRKTKGNMIKFLLGISVLVFLALFIFMQYYAFIQNIDSLNNFEIASVEFEYNVLMILFLIGFTHFCYIQKILLYKGDVNEE